MTSCMASMQGQQHVKGRQDGNTAYHFGRTILLWLGILERGLGANMEGLKCQTVNALGDGKTKKTSEENNR